MLQIKEQEKTEKKKLNEKRVKQSIQQSQK